MTWIAINLTYMQHIQSVSGTKKTMHSTKKYHQHWSLELEGAILIAISRRTTGNRNHDMAYIRWQIGKRITDGRRGVATGGRTTVQRPPNTVVKVQRMVKYKATVAST